MAHTSAVNFKKQGGRQGSGKQAVSGPFKYLSYAEESAAGENQRAQRSPVSYTHLDVYKRQVYTRSFFSSIAVFLPAQVCATHSPAQNAPFFDAAGRRRRFPYTCLLYTSRCV